MTGERCCPVTPEESIVIGISFFFVSLLAPWQALDRLKFNLALNRGKEHLKELAAIRAQVRIYFTESTTLKKYRMNPNLVRSGIFEYLGPNRR